MSEENLHMPPKRCEKCGKPAMLNTADLQETGVGQWEVTKHHGFCRACFEVPKMLGMAGTDLNAKLRK